jgi:phospholipid/cholesterol/gamma-HCH transport system permease protein
MISQQTYLSRRFFTPIGEQAAFFGSFFRNIFSRGFEWNELVRQCYVIGYKSLPIVAITGFVLGFVLTLQTLPSLKAFGAQQLVPGMVAVSMVREIGPVIVALICAGKISSSIGAELGSMKVTEQIDAMEVSGANPMQYLVVTRILACICMIPLLTAMSEAISLVGGFLGTNISGSMSSTLYFRKAISQLTYSDFYPALIKTVFFGLIIGFVGCYQGFHSDKGTESVGRAANTAVVTASVWVIILDAIAVQLTSSFVYHL